MSKADMSTVMMEKAISMCKPNAYMAMINIPVWMTLVSFEKLRNNLLGNYHIVNMLHCGRGIFGSDFGTTAFVFRRAKLPAYSAQFRRLFEKAGDVEQVEAKERRFLTGAGKYVSSTTNFSKIPGMPVAYWASEAFLKLFSNKSISDYAFPVEGIKSGDNETFLRFWQEIEAPKVGRIDHFEDGKTKWCFTTKGGAYRKWYGNIEYVKRFEQFNKLLDENNYGRISDSTFLQAIAACLIGKVNKADILKNLSNTLIFDNYASIEKAVTAAIEHLKGQNYGVLVANLLPYQRILVAFTYFHYKMGNKHISPQQEQYLIDYFWRCVLGKRYNSSADTNLNTDIGRIQRIVDSEIPSQEPIVLSPRSIYENGRFVLSSAYVIGMLCLMTQMAPQSFGVGRTINITNDSVSSSAKKQYHHFFPQKSEVIKSRADYKAAVNNVVNIVFMDAITNNQIDNRNPSDYITEFSASNPHFTEALESHYISINGYGIAEDDFFVFLNARSRAFYNKLCRLIIPSKVDTITDVNAIA